MLYETSPVEAARSSEVCIVTVSSDAGTTSKLNAVSALVVALFVLNYCTFCENVGYNRRAKL
jgi:hypothetical protein